MSVYPKRVVPGEPVFIHVRIKSRIPRRPLMRVLLENPSGSIRPLTQFQPFVFPAPMPDTTDTSGHPESLRRTSPVYLAARHLIGGDGDLDSMAAMIEKMQESVHFHHIHHTGEDWPLGRYRIHLEMRSNGVVWPSDTAKEAFFHLERVKLRDVKPGRSGGVATVENLSPHPVPARLCSIGAKTMWNRGLLLPPGVSKLRYKGRQGYLLYSDDRQVLPLTPAGSPHCLRNEAYTWRDAAGEDTVSIYGADARAPGWTLTGASRQTWLRANGLIQRRELRQPADAREYDALVREGLLLEIP
ncbi:MAG: hypothetical protein ACREO8_07850 [Luteimonas sp.]